MSERTSRSKHHGRHWKRKHQAQKSKTDTARRREDLDERNSTVDRAATLEMPEQGLLRGQDAQGSVELEPQAPIPANSLHVKAESSFVERLAENNRLELLKQQNNELELKCGELEATVLAERSMRMELENEVARKDQALHTLEGVRKAVEKQREKFRKRWIEAGSSVQKLKEELKRCNKVLNVQTLKELHVRIAELETELDETNKDRDKAKSEAEVHQIDLGVQKAREKYLNIRLENVEVDLAARKRKIEYLESQLARVNCAMNEEPEMNEDDFAWLFSLQSSKERGDFILEMQVRPENTFIIENMNESLISALRRLDERYTDERTSEAAFQEEIIGSTGFWRSYARLLCRACDDELLIILRISQMQQNQLLLEREFVSVLAVSYEAAQNPGKVIVGLEGWQPEWILAEDPLNLRTNLNRDKAFKVIPFQTWLSS